LPPLDDARDPRPVEGREVDEELAALTKAVGHPARVQILRLLVRCESCICGDIVDELPLAQSTVSQHLKVLKEAGLIRGEIDGPRVCYCIEPRTLRRLSRFSLASQCTRNASNRDWGVRACGC
jgi:ArsR family transcriptional regulator, arsenate/arsenite/antimonite-responsive transcriptional repressor